MRPRAPMYPSLIGIRAPIRSAWKPWRSMLPVMREPLLRLWGGGWRGRGASTEFCVKQSFHTSARKGCLNRSTDDQTVPVPPPPKPTKMAVTAPLPSAPYFHLLPSFVIHSIAVGGKPSSFTIPSPVGLNSAARTVPMLSPLGRPPSRSSAR